VNLPRNAKMADHQDPEGSAAAKPRIALPKNIAQTLKFLDDIDLETLRLSVETEFSDGAL
jgi:hypothetical protein